MCHNFKLFFDYFYSALCYMLKDQTLDISKIVKEICSVLKGNHFLDKYAIGRTSSDFPSTGGSKLYTFPPNICNSVISFFRKIKFSRGTYKNFGSTTRPISLQLVPTTPAPDGSLCSDAVEELKVCLYICEFHKDKIPLERYRDDATRETARNPQAF